MPNIATYTADAGLTPSDKGIQAAEVAGRRIGMYGHQLQQDADQIGAKIEQHQADMELSHGYAQSTSMEANLTEGWNQFVADPKNKDLIASGGAAQAYMEQVVKPSIGSFGENFQTREGKRFAVEETARIQRNLFTRTAGEQSALTGAVWQANNAQFSANMTAGLIQDPSEQNYNQTIALIQKHAEDTMPAAVEGERRASIQLEAQTHDVQRATLAWYRGQFQKVEEQYATGGKSDAEAKVRENLASQNHFQDLNQDAIPGMQPLMDEAVARGKERFQASQNINQKAQETEGKGVASSLDARVQAQLRPGATADPALPADISNFTKKYGSLLPGESSSLQSGLTHMAKPAEQRELVPDHTPMGTAMIRTLGTPQEPTDAQISQAVYTGQISDHTAGVIREGIKIGHDPANTEAVKSFKAAQGTAEKAIYSAAGVTSTNGLLAGPKAPGAAALVLQMRVDSQAVFNGWVKTEGPANAITIMSDPRNPRNFFAGMIRSYQQALKDNPNDPVSALRSQPGYQAFERIEFPNATPEQTAAAKAQPPAAPTGMQPRKANESWDAYKQRTGWH